MKIGFYFECLKSGGGVYQYALNLTDALKEIKEHDFVIFNISPDFPAENFNLPNWKIINFSEAKKESPSLGNAPKSPRSLSDLIKKTVRDILQKFHLYRIEIFLTTRQAKKRAKIIESEKVDLMFYHGPSELSFVAKIPSVVPIHDLQHLTNKGFPEVSERGQWLKREYLYHRIKKSAWKILVDSQIGKEDVNHYYSIAPEKITVLAPLPPKYLNSEISIDEAKKHTAKFSLPEKFLFYPAQFWPHKNHLNLVRAIKILKDKGIVVPLALSGAKRGLWGAYDKVVEYINENNLSSDVSFLGYVSNEEMSSLYRLATGFIMPTFFGWTNFPLVEAWYMRCPALYSNVRGCKEQAGDAALLIDPHSPEDMASKIEEFWNDENLRKKLILNGQTQLARWTKKEYNETIKNIVESFQTKK